VCWYDGFPDVTWWSSSDMSRDVPPIVCQRVEGPPPGASGSMWLRVLKLLTKVPPGPW